TPIIVASTAAIPPAAARGRDNRRKTSTISQTSSANISGGLIAALSLNLARAGHVAGEMIRHTWAVSGWCG
ncbi:MAG: hypothetical protein ACYSR6_13280, partial [Planctomycetota bacterium]